MDNISMLIEYKTVDDILKVLNPDNPKLINHIVENLDFGIRNKVKSLPLFELKDRITDTLLVICLPEEDYIEALTFVKDWAIQLEEFESAGKSLKLLNQMKKIK